MIPVDSDDKTTNLVSVDENCGHLRRTREQEAANAQVQAADPIA